MPKDKKATKPRVTFGFVTQIIGFFLLLEASICYNFKQLGRSTVSRIINERTSYTFVFDRTVNNSGTTMPWSAQAVPSNGNISVEFPPEYNLAGLTCDKIDIVSATQSFSPSFTCIIEGNRAIFAGTLTSATDLFIKTATVSYGNVLNPSPAIRTREFTGYLGIDVAVPNPSNQQTPLQLLAASFSQCSLTFGNGGFVNSTSPAIIQVTLLNPLNSSSSIRAVFPSYRSWRNDISSVQLPITSSMSCTGLANAQTTPFCIGSFTAFSVTAASLFSTAMVSNQIIRFQINNFLSPPTLEDIDTITITSLTNNFEVDTCTTKVSGLLPKPFINLAIQPIDGSMKVNQKIGIAINMTFSDTVNENDSFRITFPNSLPVTFNSVTRSGSSEGISTLTSQVLSVFMNVDFPATYWNEQFYVINFYTMTAPPSIKESDPITVQVLRNGFQKMIGTTTVKATESSLEGSVGPQNLLVNANTLYVFSIVLKDRLSSTGWLEIVFPQSIKLAATLPSVSASGTSVKTPTVAVNVLENKVTVTNLASSTFIPVQTFTLTLGSITNPGTSKPTERFSIRSYFQTGTQYLVASGTIEGFTPRAGILISSQISIGESSDTVLATPVDYTISFLTTYEIPQNGKIKLEIPSDIKMNMESLVTNCFQKINITGAKTAATCTGSLNVATSKYEITVTSIALTGRLLANTNVSLSFEGICTNPDTTRNILGFSINIYTNDNFLIEGADTGISTRASIPALCQSVTVIRDSNKNSDITSYKISLKQPSDFQASSILILTLPTALQINANTTCLNLVGTVNIACTIINSVATVTFPSASITNNTVFGLTLTNIANTPSFQPLNNPVGILTKTPDNVNSYCQSSTPISLQNNVPSSFSQIDGSYTPKIYNELTSLIINFKPSVRVVPSYLMISLATNLKVESLACSFQNVVSGGCTQLSTNTIKVTGTFNSNQMQFTIGGIRAPKFKPAISQFSSVSSFTSLDFKIDESINLIQFIVQCTLPCKTCSATTPAQCLSCYHDLTISTQTYYLTANKFCYSICPEGFYENTNTLECEACNSLCKTCELSPTNCTSCFANATAKYFYVTTTNLGTCLPLCSTFYYPNALNTCVLCESPCNDCTSKTACRTCAVDFFMYNGTCRGTCPGGITIANSTTRQCSPCSSVCATCSGTTDNCVTCSADAALFQNKTCISSCPPPLVINAGLCANCNPLCKQCSLRATNCTKCDTFSPSPYLYNNTCLDDCTPDHYKDLVIGACLSCQALNMGCRLCTDISTCTVCDAGFVELNHKCYSSVPTGFYNSNGKALPCQGDCATCVDQAAKCTSCKTFNHFSDFTCVNPCPPTFIGENKICVNCQSPCLTCSNIKKNCTSCVLNATNPVFLSNFYCIPTCPDYTYANQTTRKCEPCKDPCLKCQSQSSCTSCVNGRFRFGSECLPICPDGYIGINKICELCGGNCATCEVTQTKCKTCKPSFYFYNSSSPTCISDCSSVGLYPNTNNSQCTGCAAPCVTCANTSATCTSCATSVILFQSQCITQCPTSYYAVSSSCLPCPSLCATCTTSTICQSCTFPNYLLLNFCIPQCPADYPVITADGKCQKCSQKTCKNCNRNDYCLQCMEPFFLHFGKCVERCPKYYNQTIDNVTNLRNCVYDQESAANETAEQNLNTTLSTKSGGNLFPVPFIIGATFVGVATIMSKFQNPSTFVSGVLYSLWGIIEWASVGLMLYFYYIEHGWQKIQFYIVGGSFAFLYLLNILALLVQNVYLMGDMTFKKWLEIGSNRCCYYFCSFVSFLTTHKFKNVVFCKMFNFNFLKGQLNSVQQFRVFNAFSFLSFLSSGGILFGMGLIFSTYTLSIDQRLMAYIDATVMTLVNIVLGILNSRKEDDFFEEKTEDGYVVNKRIEDFDQLLYGMLPMTTELKLDHYEVTGKKMFSPYDTRYRHQQIPSEISEDSVRNISIQVEPILGDQSRITHLNDTQLSDLDLFERKEVSVQFDQAPPEMEDKSISMVRRNNHSISIQMDQISRNQISIQVERQREEVSIQYAPNVLEYAMGMSRQEAEISVQANPNQQEISIQYSAKPVFVNIDQSYHTDLYDELDESNQPDQSRLDESLQEQSNTNSQPQNSQSQNQTFLTHRIKKPDALLKPQLELDVNEKLKQRQLQQKKLYQQKIKEQRMQAMADFQKKKTHGQAIAQDKDEDNPIPKLNNQIRKPVNDFFNNSQSPHNNASQSIMDSRYNILNPNKQRQFSSNESRVDSKPQNPNQSVDSQNGGEKTQQEFIQMLSGKKNTKSRDRSQNAQEQNSNQQRNTDNFNFDRNSNGNALRVQVGNLLDDSNQISLNMTDDFENHQSKPNHKNPNPRFKFEHKNQLFDSGSQEHEHNNQSPEITHAELSKNYTKSISTKNMTLQNRRPPLSKGLQRGQLIDSSQEIQNSLDSQNNIIKNIINAPIQPKINDRANFRNVNSRNFKQDSSMNEEERNHNLLPDVSKRNLKSATLARNYERNHQENLQEFDDSVDQEDEHMENHEKQEPLPLPERGIDNEDEAEQLEFGESEKVLISPLNTEEMFSKPPTPHGLPRGLNKKGGKSGSKPKPNSQTKSVSMSTNQVRASSRQRPVYNELLNPSTSIKRNLDKQLQKEERKVQNRKKNLQLMEGMLQRPSNSRRGYVIEEDEEQKRKQVQKVYLNRQNLPHSSNK